MRVHKYQLPLPNDQHIFELLEGARVLHVGMQHGQPTMWVLEAEGTRAVQRFFRIFGTGHEIPDNYLYIGTAFDRSFVWHIFENPNWTFSK